MRQRAPEIYGINIKELARICRVTERTARRWKDGTRCPPQSALMLLRADLECFSKAWSGWMVRGETLISPEGWEITRTDVLSAPLLRAQLSTYQAELRRMRSEAEGLDEQPLPGSVPDAIAG